MAFDNRSDERLAAIDWKEVFVYIRVFFSFAVRIPCFPFHFARNHIRRHAHKSAMQILNLPTTTLVQHMERVRDVWECAAHQIRTIENAVAGPAVFVWLQADTYLQAQALVGCRREWEYKQRSYLQLNDRITVEQFVCVTHKVSHDYTQLRICFKHLNVTRNTLYICFRNKWISTCIRFERKIYARTTNMRICFSWKPPENLTIK